MSASLIEEPAQRESERVAEARQRAARRTMDQRSTLRPLGWAVVAVVAIGSASGHPPASLHGHGLPVTVALLCFAASLLFATTERFAAAPAAVHVGAIALTGAGGIALAALQPRDAASLAASTAVWMAVARLPQAQAAALGVGITAGLAVAAALAGSSAPAILADVLLCALLALIAQFLRKSRESQMRTEVLMAQLQDAQEEQARAAAVAERGRIAGELHDVLAHSLSGAAIQLQGARLLAERVHSDPEVGQAIARASGLVRDGLAQARQAVGALRGEELPGVRELAALVQSFRADLQVDVELTVDGEPRPVSVQAGLALYRGAQEALTNVARYAPGARTLVRLRYHPDHIALSIENGRSGAQAPPLSGVGGGRGLAGMRERAESVGGSLSAGPTEQGWRVELSVPA